jgi:hypothetical protein
VTATEIAPYVPGQPDEYRPRIVMAPEDAKALDDQLRANQLAVLRKGVDYDTIPGMGDRPTLLKPGAEKLLQWFGFGFTCERDETERDGDGNRVGVTYRCTVTKGLPGGGHVIVATCEGYAGYDEERFCQTAEQARAKAEAKEKYNAARYGRDPRPAKWENATGYQAPWNTVIKMAQKRALVGAAIDATAAAGLFTQDLEDMTPPPGRDEETGGGGRQAGDAWENATPAPARQDGGPRGTAARHDSDTPQDTRSWADTAIEQAASFRTEAEGTRLWKEAAARHLKGECTRDEQDHIQRIVEARIHDRRTEAAKRILRALDGGDPWRDKILDDLGSDDDAREALAEIQQLLGAGQLGDDRASLLARAVIARFPKAAIAAETDAS